MAELVVAVFALMMMMAMAVSVQEEPRTLQCRVPLVVFGASMMDVGENAAAFPFSSPAEFPPYGLDYFKAPAARFSNGRVISDFISLGLGYGLMQPYLNSVNPRFTNGVNFASSGSTARNSTGGGSFALNVQVQQYLLFKSKVQMVNGKFRSLPTTENLSRAIHVVMSAHNDYIATIKAPFYNPTATVDSVIAAMESALQELYNTGASVIIVMNVLPLGCTPGLLAYGKKLSKALDADSCIAEYNSLVDLHNTNLQKLVNQMHRKLGWNELVVFDLNAVYIDAVRNPSKYGVKYTLQACCGVGEIPCGSKGVLNGEMVEAGSCANPKEYISWDGLHPTESFAKQIAMAVLAGRYFKPTLSIRNACQ